MIPLSLHEKTVQPGCITNIWGRSGTGKTCLAMNVAIREAMHEKKVLYFTNDPESIAVKISAYIHDTPQGPSIEKLTRALDSIIFIHVHNFKNQNEIIELLPNAFAPGDDLVNSIPFQNFIAMGESDINPQIMDSIRKNHQPPSIIIFDEFTGLYKNHITENEEPGISNRMLASQAGFLDSMARDKNIPVIVVNGARSEQIEQNPDTAAFEDVPAANQIIERYTGIDIHVERTIVPGERLVTILNERERKKRQTECLSMGDIYDLATGV